MVTLSFICCYASVLRAASFAASPAVHIAGHDEGHHIVAAVLTMGRGSTRLDSQRDGIGNSQMVGEEDGAHHQLAGAAASGDAAHGHGGEHRHDDGQDRLIRGEVQAEHAEQERHLDDGGHGRAVHVHGGAQRQHDVADVLADAGFLRHLHVGGDGSHAGAGAEGHRRRAEQLGEHQLCAALAAAEPGIEGEEDEHVGKAHDIVNNERAAVVLHQLRPVGGHQVGEEAEEADGRIEGDELHGLHDAARDILQKLCGLCLRAAVHLDAEAEQHRRHDQGQDGAAAQQLREVGLRKEVHDHVAEAQRLADLALHDGIAAVHQGNDAADDVHQHTGDSGGNKERGDGHAHDLTGALHALHVGDGGGDGAEHHGHHHAEHHVDEQRAQEFDLAAEARRERAHQAAAHDAGEHTQNEPVVFQEFLHNDLLYNSQ